MTNIIDIVKKADPSTLVLIDELGAGTDPVEGAALAMSILERLHEKGAKIAATTHYAELKSYALSTDGVENGSCEFDVSTLKPTYRLLIGVPGRSNAFAISSRLGMEDGIIERAKQLVSSENASFEKTVESLEKSRQEYEKKTEAAEQLRQTAEKEKREAQQYKDSIESLREKELSDARARANQIVEQAKRSAYALMQEIEKLKKESEKSRDKSEIVRRAKQLMRRSMNEFDDIVNPVSELVADDDYVLPRPLKVGDEVLIADIGKTGTVTALANKKGEIEVMVGIIKMRTPESNLRLMKSSGGKASQKSSKPKPSGKVFNPAETAKSECDLRGMNVEDAILEIDRYIDRCLRLGLNEVSLIHGKGTGALRKGVQDYLRKNKFVKSFRLGTFGEGESGVTIVTLK